MNNQYQSHFNQIDNNIGVEGAQSISKSLELNTTLTYLDLAGKLFHFTHKTNKSQYQSHFNQIGNGIGVEGARSISKSLELNTTLTSLDLQGKFISLIS